jgi:DNA ligase D-like protein (predicted 3'-phosphoesterase)
MEDKLSHYHKKRNFSKTTEPKGKIQDSPVPVFVVQKHAATTLHYDFRIEIDGVLKSWAIPKGPSMDPHDKRLAIPTEDHPMEYKDFAGIIPEGEYGAGTVEIWDHGTYENLLNTPMSKSFANGKIEIKLHGKKLKGSYTLFAMKNAVAQNGKTKPWLLIKMNVE